MSGQALAQTVTPADIARQQAEINRLEAEMRDQVSVLETEAWTRQMGDEVRQIKKDTEATIERMEAARRRREEEKLKRWQADPYRYEARSECPQERETIAGAILRGIFQAARPTQPCRTYFVRILVNLDGEDVGTAPERIQGYPPVRND